MEDILEEEVETELIRDAETIESISQNIFPILKKKEEAIILNEFYKKEYKNIDLTLCIDNSNYNNTILTTLVNSNLTRAFNCFISLLGHSIKSSPEFINYINQKNSKGYNALLYSAFRGNLEILNKLIELGADISITNASGLNALHLAAQGNYPHIIVNLIEKYGMDVNSRDNKGNTALHWGVYKNNRQAVDYLIYFNVDTNLKDNDDETALDIAIKNGNDYFVKKFNDDYNVLINKRLEESKENQEQDNEVENDNELENNNQNLELNNNITTKRKKIDLIEIMNKFWDANSKNMGAFPFLLIIFTLEGINQIIILRGYNNLFMSLVFFILFFLLLFFYYVTSKSDPGEVPNKFINSLSLLAEQGEDLKNICPWCINIINENTHHCFSCNKCINYQEFHDIYLNNCIGKNNFHLYINFLYYISINFIFKFIISFWGLFWLEGERFKKVIKLIVPQIFSVGASIWFIFLKIMAKIKKYNNTFNFVNLFLKGMKINSNDSSSISTSNSKKNMNIQLTSLENTDNEIMI